MEKELVSWFESSGNAHKLAFVYLTFAQYSDGDLHDDELDKIAQVLAAWKVKDPLEAIKETADFWSPLSTQQTFEVFVACVAFMKKTMSMGLRELVLFGLLEIAGADGKYEDGELKMIEVIKEGLGD